MGRTEDRRKPNLFGGLLMAMNLTMFFFGAIFGFITLQFGSKLPMLLSPSAAKATYEFAGYKYVESHDDTIWTYGTDYFLFIIMSSFAYSLYKCSNANIASMGLFVCYAISVLAGGICHHFFTTFELRTSFFFRFVWTMSVGSVCAASGFMGCTATHIIEKVVGEQPMIPKWFWMGLSLCVTCICVFGGLSYQRPACDIFIAGTTQLPSTLYMIFALLQTDDSVGRKMFGCVGFILNAPLLPLYALAVQYTDLSVPFINTALHTCLFFAWSSQGIALLHVYAASKQKKIK